jgi:RNA exonuclease 4
MVGIGEDGDVSLLARVSVVDCAGRTLLDAYVRTPDGVVIVDYRTNVSGIQSHHLLDPAALTVEQVAERLTPLFDGGRRVIGHSPQFDFDVLPVHPPEAAVRDTASCPFLSVERHTRGLAALARDILCLDRFQASGHPHDSVDDARATMQLYLHVKSRWEEIIEAQQQEHEVKEEEAEKEANAVAGNAAAPRYFAPQSPLVSIVLGCQIADFFTAPNRDALPLVEDSYEHATHYSSTFRPLLVEEQRASTRRLLEVQAFREAGGRGGLPEPVRVTIVKLDRETGAGVLKIDPAHRRSFTPRMLSMLLRSSDEPVLLESMRGCIGVSPALPDFSPFIHHVMIVVDGEVPTSNRYRQRNQLPLHQRDATLINFRVSSKRVAEHLPSAIHAPTAPFPDSFHVLPLGSIISQLRADEALAALEDGFNKPDCCFDHILRGRIEKEDNEEKGDEEAEPLEHDEEFVQYATQVPLNDSQTSALRAAATMTDEQPILLVQGPPGTGQCETYLSPF